MKYFIDTEFIFTVGPAALVIPLSIGIVDEAGREFYRVYEAAARVTPPKFVRDHVFPVLDRQPSNTGSFKQIANDLRAFIGDHRPQFIGEYSAFDYVVLSTIMGGFDKWPQDWPMYVRDLAQEGVPLQESKRPHNALADAHAVRESYLWAYEQVTV